LQFIDSSGIKLLLRAQARAEELGSKLRIVRGSKSIQRIFELTGLEGTLPFCDEVEAHQNLSGNAPSTAESRPPTAVA
jgi:anti-anti-sigma factor